jgi:4,5-dihydroxyphthalate decarboxylase
MPNLKLTLACWDYDRTRPLMDGRVKPEGIDLDITVLRPRQTFQRMLDSREFEVSELRSPPIRRSKAAATARS